MPSFGKGAKSLWYNAPSISFSFSSNQFKNESKTDEPISSSPPAVLNNNYRPTIKEDFEQLDKIEVDPDNLNEVEFDNQDSIQSTFEVVEEETKLKAILSPSFDELASSCDLINVLD
jgi:hypothetical protein